LSIELGQASAGRVTQGCVDSTLFVCFRQRAIRPLVFGGDLGVAGLFGGSMQNARHQCAAGLTGQTEQTLDLLPDG
jgi:hypothetical protein